MIAHRRGRTITIAEDARRPIRLAPRAGRFDHLLAGLLSDDGSGSELVGKLRCAGDGGTVIAPAAASSIR